MVVMLFASLIVVAMTTGGCWQTSISAYYYTAAHSVFVASLCAIGILLITYRGSTDTEDILLDLAGVLAFVVAMVPTARPAQHLRARPAGLRRGSRDPKQHLGCHRGSGIRESRRVGAVPELARGTLRGVHLRPVGVRVLLGGRGVRRHRIHLLPHPVRRLRAHRRGDPDVRLHHRRGGDQRLSGQEPARLPTRLRAQLPRHRVRDAGGIARRRGAVTSCSTPTAAAGTTPSSGRRYC